MSEKLTVDVIVLSYAKDSKHLGQTLKCLESLARQTIVAQGQTLRIWVGENNIGVPRELYTEHLASYTGVQCKLVYTPLPFSFNEAVQVCVKAADAAPLLTERGNNCILVSNNDVVYADNCLEEMLKGLSVVDSVSPWTKGWHNDLHQSPSPATNVIEGYQVPYHVTGWSYAFNRRIIGISRYLTISELFPVEIRFWYQDNFYAAMLKLHGIKHAIIRDANAVHEHESSHELLDSAYQMKDGMKPVFEACMDRVIGSAAEKLPEAILLTVAIAGIPQRMSTTGSRLLEKLTKQAEGKPVEILSIIDNRSIRVGKKRDHLINLAQGRFVVFVDDDDDVDDTYVGSLLAAIRSAPHTDLIVFDTLVSIDGGPWKNCRYDLHTDMQDGENYERLPNHICCWRKDLAESVPHENVNWGEDNWWSFEIVKEAKTQYRIYKPLYRYHYDSKRSQMKKADEPTDLFPVERPKRKLKIAVYSICKDEATQVRGYMDSIIDADVVIVGDTGSSDGSADMLRSLGAVVHDITIRPWRFDTARNTVLSLVPADVDVCIKLDIDERMDAGWRDAIEEHWVKGETTRLAYDFHYDKSWTYRAEWIHARHGYKWIWPIHELIAKTSGVEKKVEVSTGKLSTTHNKIDKESRGQYLPMLEEFAKEEPGPRAFFYLGREYMYACKFKECIETLKKYLALPEVTWHSERSAAAMYIARAWYGLNNPGSAEAWLHRAIFEECWSREPYVELANRLYKAGQHALAYGHAVKAISITHKPPAHQYCTTRAWDETIHHIASITALELGMREKAIQHLRDAVAINPNNPTLFANCKALGIAHPLNNQQSDEAAHEGNQDCSDIVITYPTGHSFNQVLSGEQPDDDAERGGASSEAVQ